MATVSIDHQIDILGGFRTRLNEATIALERQLTDEVRRMVYNAQKTGVGYDGPIKAEGYSKSYKKYREHFGRQTAFVDVSFYKTMLESIHSRIVGKSDEKIEGVIFMLSTLGRKMPSMTERKSGANSEEAPLNSVEKAKSLRDRGFKFWGLSKDAKKRLTKSVSEAIYGRQK